MGIVSFARNLIDSRDQDPIYPVLRALGDRRGYDPDERVWLSVLYQAFYHLPSALEALRCLGPFSTAAISHGHLGTLPTGVERRGLRGGKIVAYLAHLKAEVGRDSLFQWLTRGWTTEEDVNYLVFQRRWQGLPNNGRWSSFKMAEILKVSHGLKIAAPDMDLWHATGPREGLEYLYRLSRPSLDQLDFAAERFRRRLERALDQRLDWETVETIVCNWNSTRQGRYYVGHDIDELQHQIDSADFLHPDDRRDLWAAREAVLPQAYLGEFNGWSGVQKDRQRAWVEHGLIVTRP